MKGISILGSTGSIGCSSLQVIEQFPDRFEVVALAAGRNVNLLAEQIHRFRPKLLLPNLASLRGCSSRLWARLNPTLESNPGATSLHTYLT